jgi:hypothetical protein
LENLVLIFKAPPQYFGHFSSKIAINRKSTFQKFATFGKFFAKAEIADIPYVPIPMKVGTSCVKKKYKLKD